MKKEFILKNVALYMLTTNNTMVANCHWKKFNHKSDLLILTDCDYLIEIIIKTSVKELNKTPRYKPVYTASKLIYALPESELNKLEKANIPCVAGILLVSKDGSVREYRPPHFINHTKLNLEEKLAFAKLGCYKYWELFFKSNYKLRHK